MSSLNAGNQSVRRLWGIGRILAISGLLVLAGSLAVASSLPARVAAQAAAEPLVVTQQDNGQTLYATVGQTVVVKLGDAQQWTVTVEPPGILVTQPGVGTLARGVQGVYTAAQPGTATVTGEGRPNCQPDQMCPQYIVFFQATVVVTQGPGS